MLHVRQNANQLLVVLVGPLQKSVGPLQKSVDTACCGYIWNQCHLVLDALEVIHNSSDVWLSYSNFSGQSPIKCSATALTQKVSDSDY